MEDLKKHIIRCVGNAKERFSEDALRILRGVRFAAQLGFDLEEETKEGMRLLAPTLANISAERIQVELVKMLTSDRPELIRTAYELGITKIFLPEFDRMMETAQETPHHMYTVGEHTIHAMMNVRNDKILRLTMLLHDMGKPGYKTMDAEGVAHFKMHALGSEEIAKTVLKRLKFDNDTLHKVTRLVLNHDYRMPAKAKNDKKSHEPDWGRYIPILSGSTKSRCNGAEYLSERRKTKESDRSGRIICRDYKKRAVCIVKRACSNRTGSDTGRNETGERDWETLQKLLEVVIENPELNEKECLLDIWQKGAKKQ